MQQHSYAIDDKWTAAGGEPRFDLGHPTSRMATTAAVAPRTWIPAASSTTQGVLVGQFVVVVLLVLATRPSFALHTSNELALPRINLTAVLMLATVSVAVTVLLVRSKML